MRISDWSSDVCSSDLLNTTFLAHCDAVREGGNHPISLIEPEDDGCSDADGRHEGVGKAIVSGVDAAPVLEPVEHILILRSEERRVGKECVSTCRSRWSPDH